MPTCPKCQTELILRPEINEQPPNIPLTPMLNLKLVCPLCGYVSEEKKTITPVKE